ncbi:MAG: hypothetical protein H6Q78_398 [Candidatus Krumholzibacteriota bacterium]|nr:hypothetical protein [Candidatus Krumholzibacteriota bacterium]
MTVFARGLCARGPCRSPALRRNKGPSTDTAPSDLKQPRVALMGTPTERSLRALAG